MPVRIMQPGHLSLTNGLATTSSVTVPRRLGRVWSRLLSYPTHVTGNPSLQCNSDAESFGEHKDDTIDISKLTEVKQKLKLVGINCDDSCIPGRYAHLLCPKCKGGGRSLERSLSVHIIQDGDFAMWRCFRVDCGWAGRAFAGSNKIRKVMSSRQVAEKSLGLEPLGEKLIAYLGERMISEGTLQRNSVMQRLHDQAIAFPYWHNGVLVGCKYRSMERKFRQEKGTEKWLYGLDDINETAEVIIVEGEIDKLSVEEAGFQNCVSVPSGAPPKVSNRELPPREKDTGYQYLWNCKEHLDKVSRIILGTDADTPGHALAEELARRLGKDRCWRVRWPKKDEFSYFKDANEVLKCLGPGALREVIENAELYQLHVSEEALQCTK
ncbi:hypothetical protein CISIN_1g042101mg [Citrus sinensis]|uniref:Toprim domain-containing protein n=1 Tax=Citrus sinensis TaxID=2711 RepID=A0A067GG06_CITSI|nr:hypothetical protein CISIN_1g042101mg [Citrus sinensis]